MDFLNKIKWLGHASFLINSDKIIYRPMETAKKSIKSRYCFNNS